MPYEIVMPRLGWNMEEGTLVEWLKQDGEAVRQGEMVCTICERFNIQSAN